MLRTLISLILILSAPSNFEAVAGKNKAAESKVWICTGKSAYAYHCDRNCSGLNKCRSEIKKVTLAQAKKLGRTKKCKICY